MLRFEDALARIIAFGAPALSAESVALDDAAGRVLADDVVSPVDLPGFDYSTMDGYAVATRDFDGPAPFHFPVRDESKTGKVPEPLARGTTMRIFTGAAIPEGADAVVMQENVTRDGDFATFQVVPRVHQSTRRRGEDLAAGAIALRKGTRLAAPHVALAASLDRATLSVARKPVVAIVATGDELRIPGSAPRPGTIAESNTFALRAMARRAGAIAEARPYVRDDRAETERAFAAALEEADVVVTIGGVSVGDHDLVRPALEAVGVTLDFWRVAIKPGKPLALGRKARAGRRDVIVVGLPGNAASAMVTFGLFGVPLLRAMQGDAAPFLPFVRARTTRALPHEPGRLEFARACIEATPSGLRVTPLGNQASGAVTSMANANALVCVPLESSGIAEEEDVDVVLFGDLSL